MNLDPMVSIEEDGSTPTFLSPPITPSSNPNGPKDFRTIFEENMISSRKPISHDSTSVLLLSYDSDDKLFTDIDVQDEVRCMAKETCDYRTDL